MSGTLWYMGSDSLGADTTIGTRLAQSFWNSLHERLDGPTTIAFVNRGVFLTIDDSPVLEALQHLAAGGSRILSCGTCLDYFGMRERLAVGEVGSIPVLQQLMVAAGKVISL
jgi:hypothetical protein